MPEAPPIPLDAAHVAVVCPSWVGDTVMATPVLAALRRLRPRARITAVCRPGLEDLLAGSPWVDRILRGPTKPLPQLLRLAADLRRAGAGAALLLPNSLRAALLVRLAGVPVRVGYRRGCRSLLLTRTVEAPAARPIAAVDYYARLAAAALGDEGAATGTAPQLFVTGEQHRAARHLLRDVPRPFALLCPGANRPDKRWPAERFAAVADALAARHGLAAAVTGAPAEADVAAQVVAAARGRVLDLVQRGVTLGSLKGVAAEAAVMITNDTGPRHVAAAVGTPVVALFGPTDPRWTALAGAREHLLVAEPFLPDTTTADDHPRACAITRIAVGDVLAAVARLLAGSTAAAGAAPVAAPASTPRRPAAGP